MSNSRKEVTRPCDHVMNAVREVYDSLDASERALLDKVKKKSVSKFDMSGEIEDYQDLQKEVARNPKLKAVSDAMLHFSKAKSVTDAVNDSVYYMHLTYVPAGKNETRALLDKISNDTDNLSVNPTDENLMRYKELQEQVAKNPKLNRVGGAMMVFAGSIAEVILFAPRVVAGLAASPFTDFSKGFGLGFGVNPMLKNGEICFRKGGIAAKMKENHEYIENKNRLKR